MIQSDVGREEESVGGKQRPLPRPDQQMEASWQPAPAPFVDGATAGGSATSVFSDECLQTVRAFNSQRGRAFKTCHTPPQRSEKKLGAAGRPRGHGGAVRKEAWPPTLHFIVILPEGRTHTLSCTDLVFSGFTLWRFNLFKSGLLSLFRACR